MLTDSGLCAGLETLRGVMGAGVNTLNNPINLTDFMPTESDSGGVS